MTIRSIWHINNDQTREDTRFAPVGMMTPSSSSPMSTYNGVVPTAGDPMGLTPTAEMTAQIGIGRAVVQGLLVQGCYPVVITSPEDIAFTDGDASNPRIDSVMIVIREDAYDSTGFTDVNLEVVEGTPAASPVAPDLPTTASLRLFNVLVPAGTSAGGGGIDWDNNVTDVRTYCVAVGGITIGNPAGAYAGQWKDTGGATGTLSRYNGTAWESAVRLDSAGQLIIGDVNWRRDFSNVIATDDLLRVYRSAVNDNALSFRLPSDTTASRFYINADGNMNWGVGGTTSTDTNLYRAAANSLKTDDEFNAQVQTLTTGFTENSGWNWLDMVIRKTCGVVSVTVEFERTGADIVPTASGTTSQGNINDETIGAIPASGGGLTNIRPTSRLVEGIVCNGFGAGGIQLQTDGEIVFRTWQPNNVISAGQTFRCLFTYIP